MEILDNGNVVLENVGVIFKNFAGEAGKWNTLGDRNFCIVIPPDAADYLRSLNCKVKESKPRPDDPDYVPFLFVKVKLNYRDKKTNLPLNRPPKIYFINSRGRFLLNEDNVKVLDSKRIIGADIEINPWKSTNRTTGEPVTTLYVAELDATIEESYLERKYADYDGPEPNLPFNVD